MFHKILIANRGEIAVRIIRTAKRMGILTVAIYADDDRDSLHVELADESFLLPGTQLTETYLNQNLIIQLALQSGAEAIHPGYGFLSENASFAARTEQAGLVFIGATPEQISLMGEKTKAIGFAKGLEIPVIPGEKGTVDELLQKDYDFPVLVKASSGGGGKGMQIVRHPGELSEALNKAQRQAELYFTDGTVFVERYIPKARHIEVQIMGDGKGEAVHLFERECSIQRRYQKLVEESPAMGVSSGLKERLYAYATRIAKTIRYRGAGTAEFLVDQEENSYFLEMNTRLQVEHPVTEAVTGLDLVEWQFRIAAGMGLPLPQNAITQHGHAIEARICAEDPSAGFKPSCGLMTAVRIPEGLRWDSFIRENMALSAAYDSLIGKLVVHEKSKEKAIGKMIAGLQKFRTGRIKTNRLFLMELIASHTFRTNKMTTCFLEEQVNHLLNLSENRREQIPVEAVLAAYLIHHYFRPKGREVTCFRSGYWRIQTALVLTVDNISYQLNVVKSGSCYRMKIGTKWSAFSEVQVEGEKIIFKMDGHFYEMMVFEEGDGAIVGYQGHDFDIRNIYSSGKRNGRNQKEWPQGIPSSIAAGLFGKVVDVLIAPGDQLMKGQNLLIIESMKMEFTIQSPVNAKVKAVHVVKGKIVQEKEILVDLES